MEHVSPAAQAENLQHLGSEKLKTKTMCFIFFKVVFVVFRFFVLSFVVFVFFFLVPPFWRSEVYLRVQTDLQPLCLSKPPVVARDHM